MSYRFKDGDVVAVQLPEEEDIIGTIRGVQTLYSNVNLWAVYVHDEYLHRIHEQNCGFSILMVVDSLVVKVDENY